MSEIPFIPIPEDAKCQEASTFSGTAYVPCGRPAVAIVFHRSDRRGYFMCQGCTSHNIHNRRGKWVSGLPSTYSLRAEVRD